MQTQTAQRRLLEALASVSRPRGMVAALVRYAEGVRIASELSDDTQAARDAGEVVNRLRGTAMFANGGFSRNQTVILPAPNVVVSGWSDRDIDRLADRIGSRVYAGARDGVGDKQRAGVAMRRAG